MKSFFANHFCKACLALCFCAAFSEKAFSTTFTWNVPTGNFSTASNWSPAGVPGAADSIIVVSGTVNLDTWNLSVAHLSIAGSGEIFDNFQNYSFAVVGDVQMSGGSYLAGGQWSIGGDLDWTGGTIGTGNNNALVTVAGEATLAYFDSNLELKGRNLRLDGGGSLGDGDNQLYYFSISNGGKLQVPAGQTLTIANADDLNFLDAYGGSGSVSVAGTLTKSGAGNLVLEIALEILGGGSVSATAGKIQICGGGSANGANLATTGLEFCSGIFYFQNTDFTGSAAVKINGGDLVLNGGFSDTCFVPAALILQDGSVGGGSVLNIGGNLQLSGGSLANTRNTNVAGNLNWTGGSVGAGNFYNDTLKISGTATLSPTIFHLSLRGKALRLGNGGNLTSGNYSFYLGENGRLLVPVGKTLTMNTASALTISNFYGGTGYITNAGTILKTGAGALTSTANFENSGTFQVNAGSGVVTWNGYFTNSGSVLVNGGGLKLGGGGNHTGTFNLAANRVLEIFNSNTNHSFTNVVATGVGQVKISDGTHYLYGSDNVFPTFWMAGGTLTGGAKLTVAGNFQFSNGSITSGGKVNIGGNLNWTGGNFSYQYYGVDTISVAGVTTLAPTAADMYLYQRVLRLNGGGSLAAGNFYFSISSSAQIWNAAGQTFTANILNDFNIGGYNGSFQNAGTFVKTGVGTLSFSTNLASSGTLQVTAGKLFLSSNSTQISGNLNLTGSEALEFFNGTHYLTDVVSTGSGTIKINSSASVNVSGTTSLHAMQVLGSIVGTGNLTVKGNLSIEDGSVYNGGFLSILGNVNFARGTLGNLSDSTTIAGTLNCTGGYFGLSNNTFGTIRVAGAATFSPTLSNIWVSGKTLVLNGGATLLDGQHLFYLQNGGKIRNPAGKNFLANLQNDLMISPNYSGTFENAGTFTKTGAGVLTFQYAAFDNTGTLQISAGKMQLCGGGTHTGNFNLTGTDALQFCGSNTTLNGIANTGSGSVLITGSVGLEGNNTLQKVKMTSGGISGTGDLNIAGTFDWTGGQISGGGLSSVITVAGLATIAPTSTSIYFSEKLLVLNGGGSLQGGYYYWWGGSGFNFAGGEIKNPVGKTLTINKEHIAGSGVLRNLGKLVKISPDYAQINASIINSGTIQSDGGTLHFAGIASNAKTGKLIGTATIHFNQLTNLGKIEPGVDSIGTLAISQNTLKVRTLNIGIKSNGQGGVAVDLLNVTGSLQLGGGTVLNVVQLDTVCLPGGSFPIISYSGSRSGTFLTTNLPAGFSVGYDPILKTVNLINNSTSVPQVTCPADISVSSDAGVCGATVGFSFILTNSCSPATVTSDPATGSFFVLGASVVTATATDNLGNTSTCSFTVNVSANTEICGNGFDDDCDGTTDEPLLLTLVAATNPTCNGGSDGSININPTCGLAPFTFVWSNGATSEDLTGIGSGTYSVTATDAQGLTKTLSATLTEPSPMSISFTATKPSCFGGSDGKLKALPSGAPAPFTYLWSNGGTVQEITDITSGDYTATATAANGCTVSGSGTVTDPPLLTVSLAIVHVKCFGQNTGSVTASAAGGTGGKTYLWSTGATTAKISNLSAGTFTVTATDTKGCAATASGIVTMPPELVLDHLLESIAGNQYKVTLLTSGGTPFPTGSPYRYCKLSGTTCSFSTTSVYSNLAANSTFTFRTRDANLCVDEITVTTPNTKPAPAPRDFSAENSNSELVESLRVLPNPFFDELEIQSVEPFEGERLVRVFDAAGRLVSEKKWVGRSGSLFFETSDLESGIYHLQVRGLDTGAAPAVFKLVKME